ncbi:hypothetical protein KI387_016323, partial [Taxus chinensis]
MRVNNLVDARQRGLLTRVNEGAVYSLLSQHLTIRRNFFIQPPKNSPSRETGSGDIRQ